jgi:hypothetical protein
MRVPLVGLVMRGGISCNSFELFWPLARVLYGYVAIK